MPKNSKTSTIFLLHLAVFLAGWTGIFGRFISLEGLPLVWYRVMVSCVTMLLAMLMLGRLHRSSAKAILRMGACGFLLAAHWVAFYASIKASNVSIGVACIATSCFFTTVFDPLLGRRKGFSPADIIISFIAIAGILLIFSLDVRYRLGIALGLLSAALYSIFAIRNIAVAEDTGEDSATMLLYELFGGLLILSATIPLYARMEGIQSITPVSNDIVSLVILGSVFTVIPFLLQLHALKYMSAFTVNVTYNLEPVYSIILASLLFNETREVGLSFWLGISLIIISVVLQTRRARKQ